MTTETKQTLIRKDVSKGTFFCLLFVVVISVYLGMTMGIGNMFGVIMNTAFDLLLNTAFYIMAIAVLAGAVSSVFSEFGVTALLNKVLRPVMRLLYGLPGASALGAVTCYFSDNPAIVPVAKEPGYAKYFKMHEWATMVNFGTVFGMGIIITGGILALGPQYGISVAIGTVCAFLGGAVGVRWLMHFTKKMYGADTPVPNELLDSEIEEVEEGYRVIREGTAFERAMNATFDGGKAGVELGLSIIPGILIFTTFVMILTNGPAGDNGQYLGVAYEGVGLLTYLADLAEPVLTPLFGFANNKVISLPLTSLGACGASIAGAKTLAEAGLLNAHDMCVYFAIAYCWAGFLSTHASMSDSLGTRKLIPKALLTHLVAGLVAGVIANYAFTLIAMIF